MPREPRGAKLSAPPRWGTFVALCSALCAWSQLSLAREAACLDETPHSCLWPEAATCRPVLSARRTLGTSKGAAPRGARLTQLALEWNCRKPGKPQTWRGGGLLPLLRPPPALVTSSM